MSAPEGRHSNQQSSLATQWAGLSRNTRIALISAGSAVLVLVLVVAIFFAFIVPQRRAVGSFSSTVTAYNAAQTILSGQIADAKDVASTVLPGQVKNQSVLADLNTAIGEASALVAPAPQESTDTAVIRQQIDDMNAKIKAAEDAGKKLTDAVSAVNESRLDLVYDNLAAAVKSAQQVYSDSEGKVANDSLRSALQTQIDNANQVLSARNGPSTSPSTPQTTDQMIVTLNGIIASVNAAAQAVTDDQQALSNTPHTYLLTGTDISCGVALCASAAVPSVKVTVTGTSVTADVCSGQNIDWNDQHAIETCTGMDGKSQWWTGWTGTRIGKSAIIQATGPGASPFFWATILFESEKPDAPVIAFVSPDRCQRVDGSYGQNVGTGCA